MACKLEIRKTIDASIAKQLPNVEAVMDQPVAIKIVNFLNSLWGNIARAYQYSHLGGYKVVISNLEKATQDEYMKQLDAEANFKRDLSFFNQDEALYEQEQREAMSQKPGGTVSSQASPKTISMIKEFLKRIGVDIKSVNMVVDGSTQDVNGIALIMQKLIQVVNGKETTALPEEAMHFAVAIIKQNNPSLYKKLMSEINSFAILNTVFKEYGTDRAYQDKDGKPNVIKLKEEAIGKVLAEVIIRNAEGITEKAELLDRVNSWWSRIVEFFKGLFSKSGFDQASLDIISGKEIGTADDIREEEGALFKQVGDQDTIFDKLGEVAATIEKKDEGYYILGKKIPWRVSELVDLAKTIAFKYSDLTKSEYQKASDELKAEKGTAGHAAFEFAFHKMVDEKGYLRDIYLDDSDYAVKGPKFDRAMYDLLRKNLEDRLKSFPVGTRFKSEITVYNGKNIAGTIDFLAVTPEGKVNILDWKFSAMNLDKYTDIPWYKVNVWRRQMEEYKKIIRSAYGVKEENFGQTRMIPIQANYTTGNAKTMSIPQLVSIKIGDVNVMNINDDYLLPVSLETERTNNVKIDVLLEKLNAVYKKFSEKKVIPSDRRNKAEQLNALFTAIRQLQMRNNTVPLVHQSKILNKQINKTIERYNTQFKGKLASEFTNKEVNDFAAELTTAQEALSTYTHLNIDLKTLFTGTLSANDKALKEDIRDTTTEAQELETELSDISKEFVANIIVKGEGVDNFLSPEKVIKGIGKWFSTTSTLQLKSIEWLYKKANKAFTYAAIDTSDENRRLEELKASFEGWARARGLAKKDYFDILKKSDKNELIDEFDPKFYKDLKQKIEEKDMAWVKDNVDTVKYNEFLKQKLIEDLQRIDDRRSHKIGTQAEIDKEVMREKIKARELYDTTTLASPGWLLYDLLRKFPNKKWESKEWTELNKTENKPAKDFYDYIRLKNEEYAELGYINKPSARMFLPFVRKGFTEGLVTNGNFKLGEQFLRDISISEGDIGYGQIDPFTKQAINVIPRYFINEIEGEVSTDLFRTMSFYSEAAIRYKYLKEMEDQVIAVLKTERNKKAILTSQFGKTVMEKGVFVETPDNADNSKLLQDMIESIIYGHKYIQSETFDQLLGKVGKWGETLNRKLGVDIFPKNLEDRQLSVNKLISSMNNMFTINILGLNLLSASSNFFGGNSNSLINAGKYFTKRDYIAAEGIIAINKFGGADKEKMIGALNYFLPYTDNMNREVTKRLSLNNLTAENLQDGLMYFMRTSDWNVQSANFYAYLANTIVQDGELLNVREYLRTTPKYADRYAATSEQRKALADEFDKDVETLMNEKGVLKLAEVKNKVFSIPGVDHKSQSVVELRRKVQLINKNALGNLTEDDVRLINLQIYGKSFMVFKNWMPRLVDVRMGNMKYNSASDAYEWGRMRMVFKVISDDLLGSMGKLKNALVGNDKGVEFMMDLFEKKKAAYFADTGKELNMTNDQFIDLVRQNIKTQLLDVIFFSSMLALLVALKAGAPDPDEDPIVKNQYSFLLRAVDKFTNELTYFYMPTSVTQIISKGIFPSVSLLTNFGTFFKNFLKENWALATGDDETLKSNKVLKYLMKSFPFTNQMEGYLPMFYPALAKDLGIKVSPNYTLF